MIWYLPITDVFAMESNKKRQHCIHVYIDMPRIWRSRVSVLNDRSLLTDSTTQVILNSILQYIELSDIYVFSNVLTDDSLSYSFSSFTSVRCDSINQRVRSAEPAELLLSVGQYQWFCTAVHTVKNTARYSVVPLCGRWLQVIKQICK